MERDRSSISDFFAKEAGKLAAFVRRRLDDAAEMEAEDLVQEVFASLFAKADPLSGIDNLPAYVYRSLRNRTIDRFRARKPSVSFEWRPEGGLSLEEILPHPDLDPCDHLVELQREKAFVDAFEALPEADRRLIEANEFEGVTFQELSRSWNVPIGTLLARKSRAIRKLSQALAEHSPNH